MMFVVEVRIKDKPCSELSLLAAPDSVGRVRLCLACPTVVLKSRHMSCLPQQRKEGWGWGSGSGSGSCVRYHMLSSYCNIIYAGNM